MTGALRAGLEEEEAEAEILACARELAQRILDSPFVARLEAAERAIAEDPELGSGWARTGAVPEWAEHPKVRAYREAWQRLSDLYRHVHAVLAFPLLARVPAARECPGGGCCCRRR